MNILLYSANTIFLNTEKAAQEIPHNTSTNVWDDTDQPVWNFNSLNSTGLVGRNESEDDGIASDTGVLDPEANEGSLGNRLMEDYDFGDDGPVKSGWSGVGTPITDQDDE
jgi:hypothetical protein